jgi:hypothetical protein
MRVIDRVEPYQRGEKPDVGLGETPSEEPAALREAPFQPV